MFWSRKPKAELKPARRCNSVTVVHVIDGGIQSTTYTAPAPHVHMEAEVVDDTLWIRECEFGRRGSPAVAMFMTNRVVMVTSDFELGA